MEFSDRWSVRAPADPSGGPADVSALLRRAADYLDALGSVYVEDITLRRETTESGGTIVLTVSFDHHRLPADLDYLDPRMAAIFDDGDAPRADFDFMLSLAAEVGARTVVDLGCGTGRLATALAAGGRRVIAVDPAAPMVEVARRRPDANRVEWVVGDAGVLGALEADLVVMTGNISGYVVDDAEWDRMLEHVHAALRPGGYLAFASRNPEDRAWERWDDTQGEDADAGIAWTSNAVGVEAGSVRVDGKIVFLGTGEELVAGSEYRIRTLDELTSSLARAGFAIEQTYGDWVRGALSGSSEDIVFVARRT